MKTTFGIATSSKLADLNYENKAIYDSASKYFDLVYLLDTRKISFQFIRGKGEVIIKHLDEDISDLSALNIRGTRNREASTSILAHSLNYNGCILNDPVSRFRVGYASKLLSTVSRYKYNTGTSSFLAFDLESCLTLLKDIKLLNVFPLIVKPIKGSKGKGIKELSDYAAALEFVHSYFQDRVDKDLPILFQEKMNFISEYRVFVIDRKVIDIALKTPSRGKIVANAAQGAIFSKSRNDEIVKYVESTIRDDGIYGIDVAVDETGEKHIIEANRAPLWETFEKTTGISISELIVKKALKEFLNKNQT